MITVQIGETFSVPLETGNFALGIRWRTLIIWLVTLSPEFQSHSFLCYDQIRSALDLVLYNLPKRW